jgi:hypothetical protein
MTDEDCVRKLTVLYLNVGEVRHIVDKWWPKTDNKGLVIENEKN